MDKRSEEVTRLCGSCRESVTRADERAGRCPHCGQVLLSLVQGDQERDTEDRGNDVD